MALKITDEIVLPFIIIIIIIIIIILLLLLRSWWWLLVKELLLLFEIFKWLDIPVHINFRVAILRP